MKTHLIIASASLPIAALAAFGAWHLADSPSQVISSQVAAQAEIRPVVVNAGRTVVGEHETRSGKVESVDHALPEASGADQWQAVAMDSSRPRAERAAAAAALLGTASKAQATAFLKAVSDLEAAQPGAGAWLLDLNGVRLGQGASGAMVEALIPSQGQSSQLSDVMQEVVFKGLRTDHNAELVGQALTDRWAAEPTSLIRSQVESLDNAWFYAGSAIVGGQKGDAQMVQEALARLETCQSTSTPHALLALAQSRLATTDDVADTLHYWAQRQPDVAATLGSLTALLVESTDPAQRSLLAIAIAGANGQGGARTVLEKALSQANGGDRASIEYAIRLADETSTAAGRATP